MPGPLGAGAFVAKSAAKAGVAMSAAAKCDCDSRFHHGRLLQIVHLVRSVRLVMFLTERAEHVVLLPGLGNRLSVCLDRSVITI